MASQFINYASVMTLIFQSASSQTLVVALQTSAHVLNVADSWTLTGTLNMTASQAGSWQNTIFIKETSKTTISALCGFDYADCSSSTPRACRCTDHTADQYKFIVRIQGDVSQSQLDIHAYVSNGGFGQPLTSNTITLPLMYSVSGSGPSHGGNIDGRFVGVTAGIVTIVVGKSRLFI